MTPEQQAGQLATAYLESRHRLRDRPGVKPGEAEFDRPAGITEPGLTAFRELLGPELHVTVTNLRIIVVPKQGIATRVLDQLAQRIDRQLGRR